MSQDFDLSYKDKLFAKQNPVLVKPEIGKVKQTTYTLPQNNHIYGKAPQRQPEGAKEVTMSWQYHTSTTHQIGGRNFKELNKLSLKEKIVKPKGLQQFRQQNDIQQKVKEGKQGIEMILPTEEFRYGISNKPSTPMKDVMGFNYAFEAESLRQNSYQLKILQEKQKRQELRQHRGLNLSQNQQTLQAHVNAIKQQVQPAQQHRTLSPESQNNDLFKIQRFKNVQSKVYKQITPHHSIHVDAQQQQQQAAKHV